MLEKFFEKVDMLIEIIKGDDPVIDEMLLDDFIYSYDCYINPDDILKLAKEREQQEKEEQTEIK